jgi:hypothetical protein
MGYKVKIGEFEVTCDTPADVLALSGKKTGGRDSSTGKPKAGVAKSWIEARKYAKKTGISPAEARKKLAKEKTQPAPKKVPTRKPKS